MFCGGLPEETKKINYGRMKISMLSRRGWAYSQLQMAKEGFNICIIDSEEIADEHVD